MNRRMQITMLVVLVLLAVPLVALAHDQEEPLALQAAEFAAVAQKAAEHSNAPRTFAPCVDGSPGSSPVIKSIS